MLGSRLCAKRTSTPVYKPEMKTSTRIQTLSAVSLLAFLGATASAIILPPTEDTSSTSTFAGRPPVLTKTAVTSTNGAATTLPVSRTRTAFIQFNAGSLSTVALPAGSITPASVAKARLTVFLPTVTKAGALSLHVVTNDWSETFTERSRVQPTVAAPFATIPVGQVIKKQFVIVDVTTQVRAWLTTPATDFGIAVASPDGIAVVALGSKEGPASGPAATLEIDIAGGSFAAPVSGTSASFTGTVAANNFVGSGAGLTILSAPNLAGALPAISGAALTGLNGASIATGTVPDARLSSNVLLLNTAAGNVRLLGTLRQGSETGTTEGLTGSITSGVLTRRIVSTSNTAGRVVARTNRCTLERDGTDGGFVVNFPAGVASSISVSAMGFDSTGAVVNSYFSNGNLSAATSIPVFTNAQDVVFFRCQFGDTLAQDDHLTEVTFSRTKNGGPDRWAGFVTTTFNQ